MTVGLKERKDGGNGLRVDITFLEEVREGKYAMVGKVPPGCSRMDVKAEAIFVEDETVYLYGMR